MTTRRRSVAWVVQVDGRELPEELAARLVAGEVHEDLTRPDMIRLAFRDPNRDVLDTGGFRLGATVEILVMSDDEPFGETLAEAEVTAVEITYDGHGTTTVVRGFDLSHRLFRGRRTETYRNMSASDVVAKVAQRVDLRLGTVDATSTVFDHLSQHNETDFAFLRRLAREEGRELVVADGQLHFRNPSDVSGAPGFGDVESIEPLELVVGGDVLRLQASVSCHDQVTEVEVRAWDPSRKDVLVGTSEVATGGVSNGAAPADVARLFGQPRHVHSSTPFATQPEVDAAATALADTVARASVDFVGTAVGSARIKAGVAVSLANAGEPFDGRYVLTSTHHEWSPGTGYLTEFAVTTETALLDRTGGGADERRISGAVPAIVTNVDDPENLGRVKVKLPWLSDEYESDWARVSGAGAGSSRGAVYLPEVNDEVLVAFEQGDLRRPYILGGLYNGVDMPPHGDGLVDASTGEVRRRGFVSKKNNTLVFFDDKSKEGIALLTGDRGLRIALNKTKKVIRIASNGRVEIAAQGGVTVSAANVKLEARENFEIEGTQVSIKGKTVTIEGTGSTKVKGQPIELN